MFNSRPPCDSQFVQSSVSVVVQCVFLFVAPNLNCCIAFAECLRLQSTSTRPNLSKLIQTQPNNSKPVQTPLHTVFVCSTVKWFVRSTMPLASEHVFPISPVGPQVGSFFFAARFVWHFQIFDTTSSVGSTAPKSWRLSEERTPQAHASLSSIARAQIGHDQTFAILD